MFTKWKLPRWHRSLFKSWLLVSSPILGEANAEIGGVRHVGGIPCGRKSGREPADRAWESFLIAVQAKHVWKSSKKEGIEWEAPQNSFEKVSVRPVGCPEQEWGLPVAEVSIGQEWPACAQGLTGAAWGQVWLLVKLSCIYKSSRWRRSGNYTPVEDALKGELLGEPPWHHTCGFILYNSASVNLL